MKGVHFYVLISLFDRDWLAPAAGGSSLSFAKMSLLGVHRGGGDRRTKKKD